MLYPQTTIEQKLGFDKIRELLKLECISSLGQGYVEKLKFSDNFELIDKLCKQTAEFKNLIQSGETFPQQNYINALPYLAKAQIEGTFLDEKEFFELKISLQTIRDCLLFFDHKAEDVYPLLKELSQNVEFDKSLPKKIELVIDDRGKIRDSASPELASVRKAIINEQSNLRRQLDQILKKAKQEGFIKEDANLTIREGRMVIPVPAENKRKIKGFVHDESATGQTVFLEPTEILDLNNAIKELEYRERREVIKILTELSNAIRPQIPMLKKAYMFLGMIDFIRAKAKFAIKTLANNPLFSAKPFCYWREAKHPLLLLNFKSQQKEVIPLNISMNENQRIVLISGPNAGGKSIALKTVGLLQYMYQSGLLIPLREDSEIGLFKDIFIDIGDEQSLENDLSTYSSHLTNMKHFLQFGNAKTLFLIDEFGTGTEPSMGAAIAEAILEQLQKVKSYGVITTHYTNLKLFAENTPGVVNAAMRFDVENLEPLYQLEIGKPGSSFAFEIAYKIGLPKAIIEKSKRNAGSKQVDFDKLLRELEIEKKNFAENNQSLSAKERDMKQTNEDYQKLKDYLEKEKKTILNKAKEEAKKIVQQANQQIEQTIRQIKENKAEKETTKELRKELEVFTKTLETEVIEQEPLEEIEVIEGIIEAGNYVRIIGQAAIGQVIAVKGKNVEMMIGELKSNVKLNRVEKVNRKEVRNQKNEIRSSLKGFDMNERMVNFSYKLDLRGKRGEEALQMVIDFMDNAILLSQNEVHIIHGKGDGILRNLIRQHLGKYKEIQSMEDEHADRGGAGVTIVRLK